MEKSGHWWQHEPFFLRLAKYSWCECATSDNRDVRIHEVPAMAQPPTQVIN
jgi:hypothetical protein